MQEIHPSMRPGAIIGYRKNGAPIRLIAGGRQEPGEGDAGQGGNGQDGGTGAGDGQQGGDHGSGDGDGTGTGGQDDGGEGGQAGSGTSGGQQGDDSAARTIAAVRADFKTERGKRQKLEKDLAAIQQAMAEQKTATDQRNKELAKALGLAGDEPPDPAELQRQLQAAQQATQDAISKSTTRERDLTVENALLKQARRHGADPDLLVDSRSFMSTLASLDPASDDFADELGEAVKAAVERNPSFKRATPGDGSSGTSNAAGSGGSDGQGSGDAGQQGGKQGSRTTAPPSRSGTDEGHNGAGGGNRQWTVEDVQKASPAEVDEAKEQGLLTAIGIPPSKKKRR